jgi:multisubunit Na+/H+ antiporter MnhC subunit
MQATVGYTALNLRDLSVDGLTYGLLICTGAALIMAQKLTNRTMSKRTVGFAVFAAGLGTLLIFVGDLAQGFVQSSVQSDVVTENGVTTPVVAGWTDVIFAGSLYQGDSPVGKFLLSLRSLHLLGTVLIALGMIGMTLEFYLHMAGAGSEGYAEPDLENKDKDLPPTPAAHGAHH